MRTLLIGLQFLWIMFPVCSQNLSQRIQSYTQPLVETNNFSGQILIHQKGKLVYDQRFGLANQAQSLPVSAETLFQIASVSKSFTAVAILRLYEEGKLRLDQPLSDFLPTYPRGQEIQIHHLLTHSSGIANLNRLDIYDSLEKVQHTAADLIPFYRDIPLAFEPGEKYSYSNSNYNLLAYLIEQASGKSFGTYLKETFFDPLEMKNTGHPHPGYPANAVRAQGYVPQSITDAAPAREINWTVKTGNGSLYSTAHDLMKWSEALFGGKVLQSATLRLMQTEHMDNVGYGWFIRPRNGHPQLHINGRSPGFSAVISHFPEEELHIVILSNNYVPIATQMSIDFSAMILQDPQSPLIQGNGTIPQELGKQWVGEYQFGPDFYQANKLHTARIENDYLMIDWGVLLYKGGNTFIHRDYWTEVRFEQDEEGRWMMNYDGFVGPRKE